MGSAHFLVLTIASSKSLNYVVWVCIDIVNVGVFGSLESTMERDLML